MRRTILLAALLLTACGRDGQPRQPVSPAAAAAVREEEAPSVSDFGQDMTARGNEPFWALRIQGTRFTLMRPGRPETVFEAPGATIVPGMAKWTAKSADGATLDVSLYVSDCSDGMSDQRYPMSAEVKLAGETTLSGCAAKTSTLPKATK
jgi:uncharacterized membrane protein